MYHNYSETPSYSCKNGNQENDNKYWWGSEEGGTLNSVMDMWVSAATTEMWRLLKKKKKKKLNHRTPLWPAIPLIG